MRREVRKARKNGIAVATASLAEFLPVHEAGRGRAARENAPVLARIDAAAGEREARTILVARDAEGGLHSGGYFVHDERFTYYLVGGTAAEHRTSGAASLVMWEAIERAAARGTAFDFEGSMIREVERFFRAFGGVPVPYSIVRKNASRAFRVARAFNRLRAKARR